MAVDARQLAIGTEVELEHTRSRAVARKIALDHLHELPDYYTRLIKMEERAKRGEAPNPEVRPVWARLQHPAHKAIVESLSRLPLDELQRMKANIEATELEARKHPHTGDTQARLAEELGEVCAAIDMKRGEAPNPACDRWSRIRYGNVADFLADAAQAKSERQRQEYLERASLLQRLAEAWETIEECMEQMGATGCAQSGVSEAQYYTLPRGALVRVAEHCAEKAHSLRGVSVELLIRNSGAVELRSGEDLRKRYEHWWIGTTPVGSDAVGRIVAQCLANKEGRPRP
jgi:hypothetical protein